MSRTYRRKGWTYNGTRNSFAYESEKDLKRIARWAEFWEQETGRKVTFNRRWENPHWCEWRYHADRGKYYGVPGWFRNVYYYSPERAAMRAELQDVKRCADWEDADPFVDIHHDLWWDWC